MTLLTLKPILNRAYQKGDAVGAFNIVTLTFLEAITDAARRTACPVILKIAKVHLPFLTVENIVPVVRQIANGFTSIMFDGSHLGFEENIRQTREVVNMSHARNIAVEAELGAVGGAEGGGLVGEADPETME